MSTSSKSASAEWRTGKSDQDVIRSFAEDPAAAKQRHYPRPTRQKTTFEHKESLDMDGSYGGRHQKSWECQEKGPA